MLMCFSTHILAKMNSNWPYIYVSDQEFGTLHYTNVYWGFCCSIDLHLHTLLNYLFWTKVISYKLFIPHNNQPLSSLSISYDYFQDQSQVILLTMSYTRWSQFPYDYKKKLHSFSELHSSKPHWNNQEDAERLKNETALWKIDAIENEYHKKKDECYGWMLRMYHITSCK